MRAYETLTRRSYNNLTVAIFAAAGARAHRGVPGQGGGQHRRAGRPGLRRLEDGADLVRVVAAAGRVAWVMLEPRTGRTHHLRAHCAALGTPILGDGKYGGKRAFVSGDGVGRGLHLYARDVRAPHPAGGNIEITAPLPPHMRRTWQFFGLDEEDGPDPWGLS